MSATRCRKFAVNRHGTIAEEHHGSPTIRTDRHRDARIRRESVQRRHRSGPARTRRSGSRSARSSWAPSVLTGRTSSSTDGQLEGGLLDSDDVEEVGKASAPNTSIAVLAIENIWAIPLIDEVCRSGRDLIDQA
jgi:hypothetical protein